MEKQTKVKQRQTAIDFFGDRLFSAIDFFGDQLFSAIDFFGDRLFSAIDFFRRSSLAAWAKSCSPKLIWSSSMLHFNQAKLFKFKFQHLYILQCLSSKMLLLSQTIIEPSFSFTVCVTRTTKKYSIQCCLSCLNSLTSWRC